MGAIKGLIPYFYNGTLGVCFGICFNWSKKNRKMECYIPEKDEGDVNRAQKKLVDMESEIKTRLSMFEWTLRELDPVGSFTRDYTLSEKSGFAGSPIIAMEQFLKTDHGDKDIILCFYFKAKRTSDPEGHAIAMSFQERTAECYLMDPNFGVAKYSHPHALVKNVSLLLKHYVFPTGIISSFLIIERDTNQQRITKARNEFLSGNV